MANRYWVGGTASWDGTAGTKWALTSGGAGGQAIPTSADDVFFDANSGANTVTIATGNTGAKSINCTGFTGTLAGTATISVAGSVTFAAAMTLTYSGKITITATATITSAGKTLGDLTLNSAGATFQLADNLTVNAANTLTLTAGTLSLQTFSASTGSFSSTNSNVRGVDFGASGKIILTSASSATTIFTTSTASNLTVSGTSLVECRCTGTGSRTLSTGSPLEANTFNFSFLSTSAVTYSFTASDRVKSIVCNGSSQTVDIGGVSLYGSLTHTTTTGTTTFSAGAAVKFNATSGTNTINSGGTTFDFPITLDGVGGTLQLAANLSINSTRAFTHTNGTLDLNGKTLTVGTGYVTATGTKNLTFNGGTIVCPAATVTAWNNAAPTGFTTAAGTGTGKISMTAATAKTFVGGGSTYNCTLSNDGAGALTITDSNTITTLANGVQPTTFTFTAGTTTTLTNWSVSGTAGNLVTIGSATAASHTLSKSSGTVNANYLSISYSTATGGAAWYAGTTSTNGGNNTGWIFTAPPAEATGGSFMSFFF